MKVSSGFTTQDDFTRKTGAEKSENIRKEVQNSNDCANSICDPEYYQAYNNISFGKKDEKSAQASEKPFFALFDKTGSPLRIISEITLNSGEKRNLIIKRGTVNKFLKTPDNKIDDETTVRFISECKNFLENEISENDALNEFLSAVASGKSANNKEKNITYFDRGDGLREAILPSLSISDQTQFIHTVFDRIVDEKAREDMAGYILDGCEKEDETGQNETAIRRCEYLFSLCKTGNGYDFSNLEEKRELVYEFERIKSNYGNSECGDIASEIIECSKSKDGRFDINFAKILCSLINNTKTYCPERLVSHRSDVIKGFTAKDKSHAKEIEEYMVKLSSVLEIDDEVPTFETAFLHAFNQKTGSFDKKAAGLLLEAAPVVLDLTEDIPIETEEDYMNYNKAKTDLLDMYFQEAKDGKSGKIKQNCISPAEYFKNQTPVFTEEE